MTTFIPMKAVGVKELKARLSEYLRYVKAGEPVSMIPPTWPSPARSFAR